MRTLSVVLVVAAAITVLAVGSVAFAASAPSLPSAFTRPALTTDRLPSAFPSNLPILPGEGRPYASRRIATYKGTKRTWTVYIFKQRMRGFKQKRARENICVLVFEGGGSGGGCSPTASFFGPARQVVATSGRVFAGVASDRVARVVVIGSQGVVHEVPLSPDHGFIFNCRAYNGCACVISRLQAFDTTGNRIENQDWHSRARNCRRQ